LQVAPVDEQQWLRRARQGDAEAFAALVEWYWPHIYRWLYGMTRRSHVAEDLTQDAFLKAWTALPSLADERAFRPWLFRIARNCFLDSRRGPRAAPVQELPTGITTREPGPVDAVLFREGENFLQRAFERLPAKYLAPLILWTEEEFSYAEIAQALAITEETARWRVCKARSLLLKQLGPYLDRKDS
jgi:RNA polymerase sigma-70 factor (ECF subfamily)